MSQWRFWIDRGGTFTDVVACAPDGRQIVEKLLSSNPTHYADAAAEGIRRILKTHEAEAAIAVEVRLGTTVATNALLERDGVDVVFVTTQGFGDALAIGNQARPDIFAREIVKPEQLYRRVIEVRERVTSTGAVLIPLDEIHARTDLTAAYAAGFRAVAIACIHGWAFPEHERRLATIARDIGFTQISMSSEISGRMKFIPRADTTVADAYLSPLLRDYVEHFAHPLEAAGARVLFMQSNGGLAAASGFKGRNAVLSGPAGGVVAMAAAARRAGFTHALGFDMGGTSTDVSHYAGAYERTHDSVVAGVRLSVPMLQVHTVAAGGGSICRFDGSRLRVGPRSAGADPGPACYRRGGPLTITDCNVLLGRVRPEYFPAIFGPAGDETLDIKAVKERFATLCEAIERMTGRAMSPEEVAAGFLEIANLQMAEAIKNISIKRGHDPAEYALVAFGGAGGQHACAVADAIGARTVLLHPHAGVLSAWGMGLADMRAIAEETIEKPLGFRLEGHIDALVEKARTALREQGAEEISVEVTAHLKYQGADSTLPFPLADNDSLTCGFQAEHKKRFGFADDTQTIMLATLSVEAVARGADGLARDSLPSLRTSPRPGATVMVHCGGSAHAVPVYERAELALDFSGDGPALVCERGATTFVDAGWRMRINVHGDLILEREEGDARRVILDAAPDPILLEVFNNRFMAVAEEMGMALQTTASSVNIKERLDFSCAVFDGSGGLVANAPHIPVHLGSMGASVREIMGKRRGAMRAGDVFMLNAPHAGGTHLPDITVLAPVMLEGGQDPAFYTAARGHHADIGGITPGSMPPDSRSVEDEGVLIENFLLVEGGRFREGEVRALMASGPHPARDIDRNVADLKAQVAACLRGGEELKHLVERYGRAGVDAYMRHVQNNAEAQVRGIVATLSPGQIEVPLDFGGTIRVSIAPDYARRSVRIDFTGTSAQHDGNFNAPLSITHAATLYVFRTLVHDNIPLNEGCLKPLEIIVPQGCLLNPLPGAAVVAGNVETSQIIVDALYGVMGALAASQGTMNNLTFGDDRRQYYETIAGGAGAGPSFGGASAVQTHMTNSRLTDPEVLESRFPVLLEAFSIRRGSGGKGAHNGGDGVVRRIRFLEPMTVAILSNRRSTAPFGLAGGGAGAPGANSIERADGSVIRLAGAGKAWLDANDVIVVETPGGGGYGRA